MTCETCGQDPCDHESGSPNCIYSRDLWIPAEKEASAEILQRCRATGSSGWVMRVFGDPERCYVISLRQSEPVPDSDWMRRDKRIAEGDSWIEVLAALPS